MRLVVALGGNALLRRGEPLEAELQRQNVARAADMLAALAADHDLVITHGNGPQVGLLALQAAAYREVAPYPLDVLGAESEGMIGYLIEQELGARLPQKNVATLLTQVEVDAADPAFQTPTKPIGPVYDKATARHLNETRGWRLAPDGDGFRRVVPSPEPMRILELATIRLLVEAGVIVICAGGGGIPVVIGASGATRGAAAVIDKDLASGLLAESLSVDGFVMLTDVPAVYAGWKTAQPRAIKAAAPAQLRALDSAAGSMGPKVEAACRFVERTGKWAAIGALVDGEAVVAGTAGTRVQRDLSTLSYWET